ncbi:MAG: glycosyltransferase family 1 protein [Chitinophagales bacterium]|nr:glycosyltransferase family 4 protein [Chitinophagales bacterium]MDW8393622.1 glycosyltransferase family 1 protein [Chitinophagales bacterium]
MNIAVNVRVLLEGKLEGIGVFTAETLRLITRQHPEHVFYFLFDRPYSSSFVFSDNVRPVVIGPQARHPLLWYWWFEWSVPQVLRRIKADLFVSPDGYGSLRAHCPQVVVMHDLAFEHFDDQMDALSKAYYRHFSPKYARKAVRLVTVSEFSRNDIAKRYGIDESQIDVACNGVDDYFRPLDSDQQQQVRDRLTGGRPYFLYAGALQPRKNIVRLLQAYDRYRSQNPDGLCLVLAGRKWSYPEAYRMLHEMRFRSDVIHTGHMSRAELARLMGAATALVYVSLFEGFGIPLVEAMYSDVPVITSRTSSMPEVAGQAALLVDPFSVSEIAAALQAISSDGELRRQLIAAGRQQRQRYSWQRAADQFWHAIDYGLQFARSQNS